MRLTWHRSAPFPFPGEAKDRSGGTEGQAGSPPPQHPSAFLDATAAGTVPSFALIALRVAVTPISTMQTMLRVALICHGCFSWHRLMGACPCR